MFNLERLSMEIETVSRLIMIIAPAEHLEDEALSVWKERKKVIARKQVYFIFGWIVASAVIWYIFGK
jgi:hypothetical protein